MNSRQATQKPTIRDARNYFRAMIYRDETATLHPFYAKALKGHNMRELLGGFKPRPDRLWANVDAAFSVFERIYDANGRKMTVVNVDYINAYVAKHFTPKELRFLSMVSFIPWVPEKRLDKQEGIRHIVEANETIARAVYERVDVPPGEFMRILDLGSGNGTTTEVLVDEKPEGQKAMIWGVDFTVPFHRLYCEFASRISTDELRVIPVYADLADMTGYLGAFSQEVPPHAAVASYSWHHLNTEDQESILTHFRWLGVQFVAISDPSGRSPFNLETLCSLNPGDTIFANFSYADELAASLKRCGYLPEIVSDDHEGNAGYIILAKRAP